MNTIRSFLLLAAALVLLSGCSTFPDAGFDYEPASDEEIAAVAVSRLNSDIMTGRATLSVSVLNGRATLYGTVPDPVTRERAIQILQGSPGIQEVRDHTRRQ